MRKAIAMAMVLALGGVLLAACSSSNTDQLTATTWYLVAGGEKNPSWQWTVPPDLQSRYTIRFEKNSTFTSRADCNQLAGSWEARGSDRVTITPGPMSMAFCGELSLDILYASTLSQVRSWNVASTGLSLTLADGGRLDYTSIAPPSPSPSAGESAEPTVTPTPSPAPTATLTVTVPPSTTPTPSTPSTVRPTSTPSASTVRPTPTPTPSASTVRPTPTPTPSASTVRPTSTPTPKPTPEPTPGPGLTSREWKLTAFTLLVPPFQGSVPQDQQADYTLQFRADGTFTARADCNTVSGTYSPSNPSGSSSSLTLVPGVATIVACSEGSYGDLYLTGIGNTVSFAIMGETLALTLVDSGKLEYR